MLEHRLTHVDLFSGILPGASPSQQDGQDSGRSPSAKTSRSVKKSSGLGSGLLHTPTTGDNHPNYDHRYPSGKMRPSPIPNLAAGIEEGIAYIDRCSSPTSTHSMAYDSEEQPCLPGVSPASLLVAPGSEKARRITATSGRKCSESYRRPGPLGCLVRTLLESSTWNSNKCVLTWRVKAMKSSRLLFQLAPSTPRTEGIGYGLLGTPVSQDDNKTPEAHMRMKARMKGGPRYKATSLQVQIAMLPTPRAEKYGPQSREDFTPNLAARVQAAMLPTPKSRNSTGAGKHGRGGEDLQTTVGTSPGLKLQPAFVEWMMGYPEGWTELKDSRR